MVKPALVKSPPTRHSQIPYALKPVLSAPTFIRSSQLKAMEIIDTAAALTIHLMLNNVK